MIQTYSLILVHVYIMSIKVSNLCILVFLEFYTVIIVALLSIPLLTIYFDPVEIEILKYIIFRDSR